MVSQLSNVPLSWTVVGIQWSEGSGGVGKGLRVGELRPVSSVWAIHGYSLALTLTSRVRLSSIEAIARGGELMKKSNMAASAADEASQSPPCLAVALPCLLESSAAS